MDSGVGCWDCELVGDRAVSRHAPDFVAGDFGKPQGAVRPGRDTTGAAKPGGNTRLASPGEFGDGSARGDTPDAAAVAVYPDLGEPNVAIRPQRDRERAVIRLRD